VWFYSQGIWIGEILEGWEWGLSNWLILMFLMSRFQDKFKWTPTEGQLRSQYWYFKKSARKMREFFYGDAEDEREGRGG
jgi:hypothetical protein